MGLILSKLCEELINILKFAMTVNSAGKCEQVTKTVKIEAEIFKMGKSRIKHYMGAVVKIKTRNFKLSLLTDILP